MSRGEGFGRRFPLTSLFAVAALIAMSGWPSGASAAEVIGQTGTSGGCSDDESYVQAAEAGPPLYTPAAYGIITSWSAMNNEDSGNTLKLLVVKPGTGPNDFIAVQKDAVRTLTKVNTLNTFTSGVRLPIEPGERLALYVPGDQPGGDYGLCDIFSASAVGNELRWNINGEPPFGTSVAFDGSGDSRLNASAVVEPDADLDNFGDESQDKCLGTAGTANGCPSSVTIDKLKQKGDTKVKATVIVPGAGTLEVGSATDPALASKAAKSLKAVTKTLTATTKQQVKLTLKLTKSAIGKLDEAGRLKVKVKAVYIPVGGPAGSQTKKKKLKT